MRKLLFILGLVLCTSLVSALQGDLDGNGEVDQWDAIEILKLTVADSMTAQEIQLSNVDKCSGADDPVDSWDAIFILKKRVTADQSWPTCPDGSISPGTIEPAHANPCAEGTELCNGACVDLQNDALHCGACDTSCNGEACVSGVCELPADPNAPRIVINSPSEGDSIEELAVIDFSLVNLVLGDGQQGEVVTICKGSDGSDCQALHTQSAGLVSLGNERYTYGFRDIDSHQLSITAQNAAVSASLHFDVIPFIDAPVLDIISHQAGDNVAAPVTLEFTLEPLRLGHGVGLRRQAGNQGTIVRLSDVIELPNGNYQYTFEDYAQQGFDVGLQLMWMSNNPQPINFQGPVQDIFVLNVYPEGSQFDQNNCLITPCTGSQGGHACDPDDPGKIYQCNPNAETGCVDILEQTCEGRAGVGTTCQETDFGGYDCFLPQGAAGQGDQNNAQPGLPGVDLNGDGQYQINELQTQAMQDHISSMNIDDLSAFWWSVFDNLE